MRRVVVESPFAARTAEAAVENRDYLRAALADCFRRGEAPFASHAIYAQRGVLNDDTPAERALGINAGLAWSALADATIIYEDLGISPGMMGAIVLAKAANRPIEYRRLGGYWTTIGLRRALIVDDSYSVASSVVEKGA